MRKLCAIAVAVGFMGMIGCGMLDKKPTPNYDPASPASQAAFYIQGKQVKTVKKVFIPAFSIGFAVKSFASAGFEAGARQALGGYVDMIMTKLNKA